VDVRDSSRTFKLFGEMHEGETRTLEGTPPYTLVLGNSPMVQISIDGKPFSTEQYARGGVARFTLDPATVGQ
jgi:cytoskeleton protein RodZ